MVRQPNAFKDLRSGIAGHGGDAHFGHNLEDAFGAGLDVVANGGLCVNFVDDSLLDEILNGFDSEIGIDCAGAVAEK